MYSYTCLNHLDVGLLIFYYYHYIFIWLFGWLSSRLVLNIVHYFFPKDLFTCLLFNKAYIYAGYLF